MSIAYLTRRTGFSAAHRYHRPEWSDAENRRVFGDCNNPFGHGHNYILEVTLEGRISPETGFSVDLGTIDALLESEIVRKLDHQHLNHAIDVFHEGGLIPTCENIAAWIWPRLATRLPDGVRLYRLKLLEDDRLGVEYFGGGQAGIPAEQAT